MQDKNMTSLYALEQLSTEQLDEMLDQELHAEPVNDEAIRMILRVLRDRETGYPVEMTAEQEAAWEKYQERSADLWKTTSRNQRIRSWLVRAASMAAILALLITILPHPAGAETFWEKLMRWTAEIVEFFGPQDNEGRLVEYEFKTNNPGLQQVYDAAVELGVNVPVVPSWLPDGSELAELKVEDFPSKKRLHAGFVNDGNSIIYYIDIYNEDVSHKYQKDETIIDKYEYSGVDHHILQNYDKIVAVWSNNNIECSLSIDCQEDALRKILKSIYTMEDS